jgi:colicin import membrane protein
MAARKLKVFQAQIGFYDTVVAAPSQPAALRAWGIHQNLFASGEASITTDDAAVAAATAHPETPLRRAVGSSHPFTLEPTSLPKVLPHAPKAAKPAGRPKPAAPPRPVDRSKLEAAEKALSALEQRRNDEEAEFRQQQDDLDARRDAAQSAYLKAREAATTKVAAARAAYRDAVGRREQ